jgi:MFS family permease
VTAPTHRVGWDDFLAEGRAARLALICLGVWLNAADSLVTSTIMPTVGRNLGGYALFSWATAAYMVGAILSGAMAGMLSARTGLRNAMVAAGLITAAGCAVSAVAPDMVTLVAGRAVQGLGSGWIVGACYVAIGAIFPERHLVRTFALMSSIWGIATVLGPLVGGLFAEGGHWRGLFWAFGAQAILFVLAAGGLLERGGTTADRRAPSRQVALVLVGVGLIALADLANSALLAALLCALSVAVFAASLRLPTRPGEGLFPRDAGNPAGVIGAGYLANFALMAASMGFSVYGPALLQKLHGLSPLMAGYVAGFESMGWTVAALAVSGLPARWHGAIIRLGGLCVVGSIAALALVTRLGPVAAIVSAAGVLGAGLGLAFGFIGRRVIAAARDGERELTSAGINSVRLVGSAAGACLAGIVANLVGWSTGVTLTTSNAASVWLFALAVPVALIGAWGAWRVAAIKEVGPLVASLDP